MSVWIHAWVWTTVEEYVVGEVGNSLFQCGEKECPWLGLRSGSAVEGHRELAGDRSQADDLLANSKVVGTTMALWCKI